MFMTLFARAFVVTAALVLTFHARDAAAQDYPNRPIRLVVPYAAGSSPDATARLLAIRLGPMLPQPVVVVNQPGAGANIGTAAVAKSKADGYTILSGGTATHAANPALFKSLPFDAIKDFDPIVNLYVSGLVLAVRANSDIKTFGDFLAKAKQAPGTLNMGIPHTTARLGNALLRQLAGVQTTPIEYGTGGALTALLAGDVHLLIDTVTVLLPRIKSGELRALAVPLKRRSTVLPDVPTFAESGVDIDLTGWTALFAPKGTPRDVIQLLNAQTNRVLREPEYLAFLTQNGIEPAGGTAQELEAWVRSEHDRWARIVQQSGLQPQ